LPEKSPRGTHLQEAYCHLEFVLRGWDRKRGPLNAIAKWRVARVCKFKMRSFLKRIELVSPRTVRKAT
jgi:hypothetical protein